MLRYPTVWSTRPACASLFPKPSLPYPAPLSNPTSLLPRAISPRLSHQTPTVQNPSNRRSRLLVPRCTPGAEGGSAGATPPDVDKLSAFLTWLLANGVEGIGGGDSKCGLYEAGEGERGMASVQDIKQGDTLLRIPLRMALTDFPEDPESNELMYPEAPWSVRLAGKLLREVARGVASPWYPYLQVLPEKVPSPLETLSWEQMAEIEYQAGISALHEYEWLVSDSYGRCSPESIGNASLEQYQWAMSIVHSRTFGNAAKEGGVGVRMLVPLVDMFNHGGDETAGLLSDPHLTTDSVRWDVVAPESNPEDGAAGWEMVVSATQDVPPGCALLLSYGERSADDFFLHYGFVPPLNPHEDVQLFANLEEALDWHYREYGQASLSEEQATPVYEKALEAAQKVQQEGGSPALYDKPAPLKAMAGGKVDAALIAAFSAVSTTGASEEDKARMAEVAVARRSWQMLGAMPTPLSVDAAALWLDAVRSGNMDQAPTYSLVLQHYHTDANKAGLGHKLLPSGMEPPAEPWGKLPTKQLAPKYLESAAEALTAAPLHPTTRLLIQFRSAKKQLLWDIVLKVKATAEELGPAKLAEQPSTGDMHDTGLVM